MPSTPKLASPLDDRARYVGVAVDRRGINVCVGERPHRRHGLLDRGLFAFGQLRVGEEAVAVKLTAKERLAKPPALAPRREALRPAAIVWLATPRRIVATWNDRVPWLIGDMATDSLQAARIQWLASSAGSLNRNCSLSPTEKKDGLRRDLERADPGTDAQAPSEIDVAFRNLASARLTHWLRHKTAAMSVDISPLPPSTSASSNSSHGSATRGSGNGLS